MATVLTPPKPETPAGLSSGGGGGGGAGGSGYGGGDSARRDWQVPARAYRTGMWMALAAIVMLFAAFTSALVVRKGISNDWVSTKLPPILWLNTVVLVASSLTLELSRRSLAAGLTGRFARWLYFTLGLGLAFIAGQLLAWRQLTSRGVYLATNPSSSFFYLLTGAHGLHLFGGICALTYMAFRAGLRPPKGFGPQAGQIALPPARRTAVEVTAIYWHFMDGLWIYILILLWTRL